MPAKVQPGKHAISEVLESRWGSIIISTIFGLALAAMFRKVCDGRRCVVVTGPEREELDRFHYKIDGECYKYQVESVACPAKGATTPVRQQ